jgi:hypothetical protein
VEQPWWLQSWQSTSGGLLRTRIILGGVLALGALACPATALVDNATCPARHEAELDRLELVLHEVWPEATIQETWSAVP